MKIATVARWKPLHLGHAAVLERLLQLAQDDELLVGIGSVNRYGPRNPFTQAETEEMLRAFLGPRSGSWRLVPVPDLDNGPRWRELVRDLFGPLDLFVSANDYVRGLLQGVYPLAHPRDLVPGERHVPIDGARVRRAMARGLRWEALVPPEVEAYLRARALPERFRREFGLAVLSGAAPQAPSGAATLAPGELGVRELAPHGRSEDRCVGLRPTPRWGCAPGPIQSSDRGSPGSPPPTR